MKKVGTLGNIFRVGRLFFLQISIEKMSVGNWRRLLAWWQATLKIFFLSHYRPATVAGHYRQGRVVWTIWTTLHDCFLTFLAFGFHQKITRFSFAPRVAPFLPLPPNRGGGDNLSLIRRILSGSTFRPGFIVSPHLHAGFGFNQSNPNSSSP